jgi:two-component system CheB/CheR fusion protein
MPLAPALQLKRHIRNGEGAMALDGVTVLVVEDDDLTRETTRRLLRSLGADVVEARDGAEGLSELERGRPDLVLCDVLMPGVDGIEFARRVRQDPRHRDIPLLALTGLDAPADFLRTWAARFDAHLTKPVTAAVLAGLEQYLPGRRRAARN